MKRLVLPALAALALTACASAPTVYQPAAGYNAIGFSEYLIEPGRYRVMFRGGSGAPAQQVMDYALIRAADLTISQGYDWFGVSDRYVAYSGGGGYGGPRISLGVGGMDWGRGSSVGAGVGTSFDMGGGRSGGAPVASLEIYMGRNPKPPGVDVYDARAVRSTLGR